MESISHPGPNDIPIDIIEEKTLFHGKWLGARQIIFKYRHSHAGSATTATCDPSKLPMWQVAYRASKPKTAAVDGVSIIATLKKTSSDGNMEKFLVLVKQFRVPLMKYSLEYPAGLLDADETAMQAALRELKEETGYTATKVLGATKGVQPLDPGLSDDSVNFVIVEIDGDAKENQEPHTKQQLDEEERIEVVLVPFDRLLDAFREFTQQGVHVEAMVYSFAIGTVFKDGLAGNGLSL